MLKKLESLGFTPNQAKVYLTLVKTEQSTIGPLEKTTGLFKQSIYNTLESLISQGFVESTKKNNRQYFSATDPEIILGKLEAKKQIAEGLIPELHALSGSEKHIGDIKVYNGISAIHSFYEKMLKRTAANCEVAVIGAGGEEFLKITRQKFFFTRYENLRIHKKISHKLLMYENQRNTNKEYTNRRYVETKFLPNSYEQPIATQIWPDRISIFLFGDDPQIIEIKSEKITKGFRNYFDMLYGIAKH